MKTPCEPRQEGILSESAGGRMMTLDADGTLLQARQVSSPNQDARPADCAVSLVVIHNISLPPGEFGGDDVLALFTNRLNPEAHPDYHDLHQLKVSAHFFIRRDGTLIQCVPVSRRAWHAGVSTWQGRERCNDFSVGIELEGSDDTPFTEAQYAVLKPLLAALKQAHPIRSIVGHADIAPNRKTDPGPHFDWSRLAQD